jgi:hypothetical protein
MKKKLNTDAIKNELAGSVFFPRPSSEPIQPEPSVSAAFSPQPSTKPEETSDTVIPRYQETTHDTTIPSNHDTMIPLSEEEILEAVRKAVRQVGKEPATQRLTLEEKQALADIEYSYKRQGIRTSGNEIIRIATNYVVREYQKNGERSILAQVIKRLNA